MSQSKNQQSMSMHQRARVSDAKRRNNISRPSMKSEKVIAHFANEPISENEMIGAAIEKMAMDGDTVEVSGGVAEFKIGKRTKTQVNKQKISAKQIKEQEIKKAFDSINRSSMNNKNKMRKHPPIEFGFKKVALALVCTAIIVFGIAYLVDANSPDVSMKVVAMQNGIKAIYPKYIPRGYGSNPADITSENGKITMNYKNAETGDSFLIIEEFSEWTDDDLFDNYVKDEFGSGYAKVDDSGMTIYIDGNNGAAWMDGNVLMKLEVTSGSLTRKQIVTIATTK